MSAAATTKIFGIKVGDSPKKTAALAAMIALAAFLFWYNSRAEQNTSPPPAGAAVPQTGAVVAQSPAQAAPGSLAARRAPKRTVRQATRPNTNDRGTLAVKPIDARNGDIDPTLRLDLLARVQNVPLESGGRSLFEPVAAVVAEKPIPKVIIPVLPQSPMTGSNLVVPPAPPPPPIPLKFYGYSRPKANATVGRGFFMDGDNILVASEGEMLKQRYRVIQLSPTSAMVEDTMTKSRQSLPLVPEAQNNGS